MAILGSGSPKNVENGGNGTSKSVDKTHNTTMFKPAGDFELTSKSSFGDKKDEASTIKVPLSDVNDRAISKVAIGVTVSVCIAALALGVSMVVCAWRASRREEEAMFLDLGDEKNYPYERFGDYAAM